MDKNFKTHKFEKKDKNEKKNYIKMFNIDKNDIMNLTDLEKINLNPIFMKEVAKFYCSFLNI